MTQTQPVNIHERQSMAYVEFSKKSEQLTEGLLTLISARKTGKILMNGVLIAVKDHELNLMIGHIMNQIDELKRSIYASHQLIVDDQGKVTPM